MVRHSPLRWHSSAAAACARSCRTLNITEVPIWVKGTLSLRQGVGNLTTVAVVASCCGVAEGRVSLAATSSLCVVGDGSLVPGLSGLTHCVGCRALYTVVGLWFEKAQTA